ncbi:MAG: DNA polymerase Y family protein [Acidimicrobiales bacterium]
MAPPVRTLVVWCPDWPLVAAGLADRPAVIVAGNRVVASSATARAEGVRLGQRRREAQACCPELVVVGEETARDARSFEAVVVAVAGFTPLVELTRPGACAIPARAAARYFGGEASLAAQVCDAAGAAVVAVADAAGTTAPEPPCRVGIADGPFAARLAARQGEIVPCSATAEWLGDFPVEVLGLPALVDVLRRLGIHTLGEFGELDEAAVLARFGTEGGFAHRLARGLDERPLALGNPPADLTVCRELDPPAERADALAFVAVGLAEELVGRLAPHGLAATQLLVEAETEHGESLQRCWRGDRPFTARAMVDRVRWQLEGWLQGPVITAPSAGVTMLRLTVGEAVPDGGRQLDFAGGMAEASRQVERGLARVQGLLGHEAVLVALRSGGRGPGEQIRLVPWGEGSAGDSAARVSSRKASRPKRAGGRSSMRAGTVRSSARDTAEAQTPPWPGRIPPPSPALVHPVPVLVEVLGPDGVPVGVTGRGQCTAAPSRLVLPIAGGPSVAITGWSGPWPADERWWDPAAARRRARLQVLLEDGTAHLVVLEQGRWHLEATYD